MPGKQAITWQNLSPKKQRVNCVLPQKHQVADEFPCKFGDFLCDSPRAWGEQLRHRKMLFPFDSLLFFLCAAGLILPTGWSLCPSSICL